jgi:hypothetical protein
MPKKKLLLFAGTGFIGQELSNFFISHWDVVVIGRTSSLQKFTTRWNRIHPNLPIKTETWDGRHIESNWSRHLEAADLVINLAGKSVNCRYNEQNKKEILESRTTTTTLIGKAIAACQNPPKLWINAGSSTIYAHSLLRGNDEYTGFISDAKYDNMPYSILDRIRFKLKRLWRICQFGNNSFEVNSLNQDFSVHVCKKWEESFYRSATPTTRKIGLRIAITLGRGGVMVPYRMLTKIGLGGAQGDGHQKLSWIHVQDVCRACEFLYEQKHLEGCFNLSAPEVISNRQFTQTMCKKMNAKIALPAGKSLLEMGALLILTETELILKSRWVISKKLQDAGFQFVYPTIDKCVDEILTNWSETQVH